MAVTVLRNSWPVSSAVHELLKGYGIFFFFQADKYHKIHGPRGEQEENSISFCLFALPNTEQCAHSKLRVKLGGLGPQPHVE